MHACLLPLSRLLQQLARLLPVGRWVVRHRGQGAWCPGYAVRRDWPDGIHEFVAFRIDGREAARFIGGDREFWRRGPVRPLVWSTVVISRRDFDLHARRHECRAPDCPKPAESESRCEGVAQ